MTKKIKIKSEKKSEKKTNKGEANDKSTKFKAKVTQESK